MEPEDLFYLCAFQWCRKLAQQCGLDFYLGGWQPSARFYLLLTALYVLLMSCLWTIYSYPFDAKIICSAILCFDLQGLVKVHSFARTTREFKDMCEFSLKVYRVNRKPSPNKEILKKSVEMTIFIFKTGMALLIATSVLTCIRPCVSYHVIGEVETILPTFFPGINDHETFGYACLAAFHIYLMYVFAIGNAGADLGLMCLVIHSHTMSHLFRNAVNEFNALVTKSSPRHTYARDIQASLHNLISMHIDFLKYTGLLKFIYTEMCLFQVAMANAIMIVLVYVTLMMDWFPAYFLMATAFFQVLEYSLLGTVVEIANDNVCEAICNMLVVQIPATSEQKKVILMTLLAQNPNNLTIGGYQLLNVKTFVYSMKTTYSVAMMLLQMQKA